MCSAGSFLCKIGKLLRRLPSTSSIEEEFTSFWRLPIFYVILHCTRQKVFLGVFHGFGFRWRDVFSIMFSKICAVFAVGQKHSVSLSLSFISRDKGKEDTLAACLFLNFIIVLKSCIWTEWTDVIVIYILKIILEANKRFLETERCFNKFCKETNKCCKTLSLLSDGIYE